MSSPDLLTQVHRNPLNPGIELKYGSQRYATRIHAHRELSMGLVISGQTQVHIADHKLHLPPGHFILIPPGVPHLCCPDSQEIFQFGMLYLDTPYLDLEDPMLQTVTLGSVDQDQFTDLGSRLVSAHPEHDLMALLQSIKQIINRQSTQAIGCDIYIPLSEQILEGENTLTEPRDHRSRYQQYRASKKRFGIGKKSIKQIQRIERSKQMLRQGESIATIAVECGFFDQSHYIKTFRLYTGITPSQYQSRSSPPIFPISQ